MLALYANAHTHTQAHACHCTAQVASDPHLLGLFEELLRDEGSELYMRSPEVYGVPVDVPKTWDEVRAVEVFMSSAYLFSCLAATAVVLS